MSAGLPQRRLKPQELTEEDTMMQHPTIALALGQQRQAAFLAEAERARLAREARAAARSARHGGGRSAKSPMRGLAPRRLFRIPATRSRLARLRPARAR
jgi:hypothetical protein